MLSVGSGGGRAVQVWARIAAERFDCLHVEGPNLQADKRAAEWGNERSGAVTE